MVDGEVVVEAAGSDIPLGHRFATAPIAAGDRLRSWGVPFGIALRDIAKGEYLCNARVLAIFAERKSNLSLPADANFENMPHQVRCPARPLARSPARGLVLWGRRARACRRAELTAGRNWDRALGWAGAGADVYAGPRGLQACR